MGKTALGGRRCQGKAYQNQEVAVANVKVMFARKVMVDGPRFVGVSMRADLYYEIQLGSSWDRVEKAYSYQLPGDASTSIPARSGKKKQCDRIAVSGGLIMPVIAPHWIGEWW